MLSKKFIFISIVSLLVFYSSTLIVYRFIESKDVYSQYEEIYYNDALEQDGDYFVYFYQDDCAYCMSIKSEIEDVFSKDELYLVDLGSKRNEDCWYDWEAHHEMYDIKIGEIVGGEEVYYNQTDEEFLAETHTDALGNEINYSIDSGKEYQKTNPTADINGIYAVNNTAQISLETEQEKISVAGTPTILEVSNGEVVGYYYGIDPVTELMEKEGGK